MDATNAPLEPPLKHAKMITLLKKISLSLLESQFLLCRVYTCIMTLELKHYTAGIESDLEVDL